MKNLKKYHRKFLYKIFSFLTSLSVVVNSFQPIVFLLAPSISKASTNLESKIEYYNNTYNIKINNADAGVSGKLDYLLAYKTDKQVEAVTGNDVDLVKDTNFSKEIYAGTCSENGKVCVPHKVLRGILKTEIKDASWLKTQWFKLENQELKIVLEEDTNQLELSDLENYWLENGVEPTPTITLTPSPTPQPTIELTEAKNNENKSVEVNLTDITLTPSLNNTNEETQSDEAGQISAIVVPVGEDVGYYFNPYLITDKPDYAPTDTVILSGTGFTPNTNYALNIYSNDYFFQDTVTTDAQGNFVYSFQLDGVYRPNYWVDVKDLNGIVITSVTFTDGCSGNNRDLGCNCNNNNQCASNFCSEGICSNPPTTNTPTPNSIISDVQTIRGSCVEDAYGSNLNCTANDVSIANVTNISIEDPCDYPGDEATFTATWNIQSNATERYNIGLYFAAQGQTSALNGTCSVSTLPNYPVPPYYNFDGNACGDISSSAPVNPRFTMTVKCMDPDGDNVLNLPYCTSWKQNDDKDLSCSGPIDAIPGAPSKCNCESGFEIPITVPYQAKIEVKKSLSPVADPGRFNLQIDGVNKANCVGNNGATNQVTVSAGTSANPGATHTVGETACTDPATNLADYNSSIECVKRGTSIIVASGSGIGPISVPVQKDDDIVCTITNTLKQGTLTVSKAVKDGPNDPYTNQSQNIGLFKWGVDSEEPNRDMGTSVDLPAGSHTITENSVNGYQFDGWHSGGEGGSCINPKSPPVNIEIIAGASTNIVLCNSRLPYCGDGLKNQENEQCDDGNNNDGDGCSSTCQIETATVTVDKITNPSGSLQEFTFHLVQIDKSSFNSDTQHFNPISGGFSQTFNITDSSEPPVITVPIGDYDLYEDSPDGWRRNDTICNYTVGDRVGWGIMSYNFNIKTGENVTCTFTNTQNGSISGYKYEDINGNGQDDDGDNNRLPEWTIFIDANTNGDLDDGETSKPTDENGNYTFNNLLPGNYQVCEVLKDGWMSTDIIDAPYEGCKDITVEPGKDTKVNFGNFDLGKVTATKFHDLNQNGTKDSDEEVLDGWIVNLTSDSDTLTQNTAPPSGQVVFDDLLAGNYTLSENQQDGWAQTNIYCDNYEGSYDNNAYLLTISSGADLNCYIGNYQLLAPSLTIAKSNNVYPSSTTPGSVVTFTLKLKVSGNNIYNAFIKDILPPGFTFNNAWSATVNGTSVSLPNPNYASPGTWQLGDLKKDDEVIITYQAKANDDIEPGLYKDLAWAVGNETDDETSTKVLALATDSGSADSGIISENFVGTKVAVDKDTQNYTSVNIKKEEQGEVLGAATGLPATGGKIIWIVIATLFTLLGSLLIFMGLMGKKLNLKKITGFFLALFLYALMTQNALAGSLSVRISEPKSPTRFNTFDLNFVALDLENNPINVDCYYKKEGGVYTHFDTTKSLAAGGNVGSCRVTSSQINEDGKTYYFYVTASNGTETVNSEIVSVDYKTSGPGTPTNYSKDHPAACEYKIKFKTADDGGKTVKVEVYRSQNTNFSLDAGTRIASIPIGSNTDYNFTDTVPPDCQKDWYYALRAFDDAGNGSGWVGDSIVTVITTTTTAQATTGNITAEAIPVANITLPAPTVEVITTPEVLGEKTTTPEAKTEEKQEKKKIKSIGEILGETVKKENKNKIIFAGLGILLLAIIGYAIYKKNKS